MNWIKNIYNKIYLGFILSIIIVFFSLRPLNSPWHKFIAGDGLGYYSYLPATFIYHDLNYEFKWFNKIHNDNYVYSSFPSPDQNFLVEYQGRKINKYYPGLSFLWLPFFAIAHIIAKLTHYTANGYSLPYQLSIGMASLLYLFLGLLFLKKLLLKLFQNEIVAVVIPILLFYGTYLFFYALYINSLSHVYSFTGITLFCYFAYSYFNDDNRKLSNFLWATFCFLLVICIRPLNGLILFAVFSFIPTGFFKRKFKLSKITIEHVFITLLCIAILINQFYILYIQTKSFIPYTYSNEHFYFSRSRFFEVLFSYHMGLFVYVPLALLAVFGIPYLQNKKQRFILPILFFSILFLYSSWWYWPIVTRALIDFYVIIAILLAGLLNKMLQQKKQTSIFFTLAILCISYYQLKSLQQKNGILIENYTYSEVYWRNFFKIHKVNQYLIPPSTIIKQETFLEDFEINTYKGMLSNANKHSGNNAIVLNKDNPFSSVFEFKYPNLFKENTINKIRFSFWANCTNQITSVHIYMKFFDENHNQIFETPFYLNQETLQPNKWNYYEFGYQLSNVDFEGKAAISSIELFIWDNENKNEIYVDDVKTEFITTDNSYEINQ